MKTYIVYAERVVSETLEIEATSEEDALAKAMEADNSEWQSDSDIDWQITSAREVEDGDDTYDEFGVNTKNSFNTQPKE